eukprot:2736855-Rhodomonas_salina.1
MMIRHTIEDLVLRSGCNSDFDFALSTPFAESPRLMVPDLKTKVHSTKNSNVSTDNTEMRRKCSDAAPIDDAFWHHIDQDLVPPLGPICVHVHETAEASMRRCGSVSREPASAATGPHDSRIGDLENPVASRMESEAALRYACSRLVGCSTRKEEDDIESALRSCKPNTKDVQRYVMQLHLHSSIQERYSMLTRNNACLDLVRLGEC